MSRVTLGEVCTEYKGRVDDVGNLPIVGLEHLSQSDIDLLGCSHEETTFTKGFLKGHVLFGRRRAYLKKASLAPFDGVCSGDIIVIEAKDGKLFPGLLPFIIQNDFLFDFAVENSAGSLSPRVKWKDLSRFEFDLPLMEEQEKLAELLWAAQETKRVYARLLLACDEMVKSRFIEMFGMIEKDQWVQLQSVCSIITDGTHQPPKFVREGIPFLLVSNIVGNAMTYDTDKYITEETYKQLIKRTPIEVGDLLVSAVGSFGHPAIIWDDRPFCFQRHIAYLKPMREQIDSVYLHATLLTNDAQEYMDRTAKGVAQRTVTLKSFKELRIPLPPLGEQKEFAAFVQQVDKSEFALKQAIDSVSATMTSILNQELGMSDV